MFEHSGCTLVCVNRNRRSVIFFVVGIIGLVRHDAGKVSEVIKTVEMVRVGVC